MTQEQVHIVSEEEIGRLGAKRTVYRLSNDWWINDLGKRPSREHRFSLYKPGVGTTDMSKGTYVAGNNKMKPLLIQANRLQEQADVSGNRNSD